jgi:hypothetical protein
MDAKRSLYQAIVRNLVPLGVPALDIKITLIEIPPENWGLRGGMPASEIDLGFKILVAVGRHRDRRVNCARKLVRARDDGFAGGKLA